MSVYSVNAKEPIHAWVPSHDTVGRDTVNLSDLVGSNAGLLQNMDPATDWVVDTDAGGSYALDCDGVNDYVTFSAIASPLPFSVSMWCKCRVSTGIHQVFGIGKTTDNSPLYVIQLRGDLAGDPVQCQMRGNNAGINTPASINGYAANTWHHIVAVFSGVSYRQIYLDSVAGTADTNTFATYTMNTMTLGQLLRVTSGYYSNCLFDDIRFFDQSLTASDVTKLYASGVGRGVNADAGGSTRQRQQQAIIQGVF